MVVRSRRFETRVLLTLALVACMPTEIDSASWWRSPGFVKALRFRVAQTAAIEEIHRRMRLASLMACCGPASAAQPPTFRTDTKVVSIFATVIDHHKRLATNLAAEDFEVLDDGRPQASAYFSNAMQPMTTVVILDTSASATLELAHVRDAAEQFVLRLLPGDRARICAFNDKIQFSPAFTSDRDSLARSVHEVDFGNGTRLYDALAASLDELTRIMAIA